MGDTVCWFWLLLGTYGKQMEPDRLCSGHRTFARLVAGAYLSFKMCDSGGTNHETCLEGTCSPISRETSASIMNFHVPKAAAGGYEEPSVGGSEMIDLHIVCLNGEGCKLTLSRPTLGREVRRMVSEQLPSKSRRLSLHHNASPLMLGKTLQEQGIEGQAVTLFCTYVPIDFYAAWSFSDLLKIFQYFQHFPLVHSPFPDVSWCFLMFF